MMDSLACTLSSFADRATGLARRIGPKRGIAALAVLSAAVGASLVVRRLRARSRKDQAITEYGGPRTKKQRRRIRRAMVADVPQAGLQP